MRESVGFISLGNMGVPAVQNLHNAGHPLSVFNRIVPCADGLCENGATQATSPRALAEQNHIVLSVVGDDTGLKVIALGDDGVLAGLTPGKIHVDMSTVSPDISKDPDHQYGAKGAHFIAVPVFGRPDVAVVTKLWICPAGSPKAVERCRPLFDAVGQVVIVVGTNPHLANSLRLVGSFFVISASETLGDAFTLAEEYGLDVETILEPS